MINEMNTHEVFKKLITRGFTEDQAEGITEAISSATPSHQTFVRKELFEDSEKDRYETKTDLALTKNALTYVKDNMVTKAELKSEMAELRSEFKSDMAELRSELRSEMAELRSEFKSDLAELRAEIKTDLKDLNNDILKWMLPLFATIIIGLFVPLFLK